MKPISVKEIIQITKGELKFGKEDLQVHDISTDSKAIKKGSLFLAIKGKHFDGHDFIQEAFLKGAAGAIISENIESFDCKKVVIKVDQTVKALGRIALYNRKRYLNTLVGITGSNGKTTTKEMVASILGKKFKVCKSEKSYNNEIGVPLTLLKVSPLHQVIVLEMGMSNLGEIENLAQISEPNIGIITNIGQTHLENLKSLENVFKGKIELLLNLVKDKIAILNADDPYTSKVKKIFKERIITVGIKNQADYRVINIKLENDREISFDIEGRAKGIKIKRLGLHNVYNASLALAVGYLFKIDLSLIKEGLLETKYPEGRFKLVKKEGKVFIDDTYNANPESVKRAIETLLSISKAKRKIVVLGDMLELGEQALSFHREVGKLIAEKREISLLFTLGELGREIGEGAKDNDFPERNIFHFKDKERLILSLQEILKPTDCVLVKGSRLMKMEEIIKEA
ncbi:MAG: UDP-N-acetylmuramoyl-tripeptide--D-alanyl-D-alanine ligase [bacterium]